MGVPRNESCMHNCTGEHWLLDYDSWTLNVYLTSLQWCILSEWWGLFKVCTFSFPVFAMLLSCCIKLCFNEITLIDVLMKIQICRFIRDLPLNISKPLTNNLLNSPGILLPPTHLFKKDLHQGIKERKFTETNAVRKTSLIMKKILWLSSVWEISSA
jgi:hypothetical protein